jgi:hypothetical protein
MTAWIHNNEPLLWWLLAASVVMFVGTLVVVPWLVIRLPADYFSDRKRRRIPWADQHEIVRGMLLIAKNATGCIFIVAGVAMLVLPGQGLLTIAMGIVLLDFPGKYRLERWLITRRYVLRSINWLRRRAGRQPLDLAGERHDGKPAGPRGQPAGADP